MLPHFRQSLSLIMVSMMAGFSQFVINILLPSTDTVTRFVKRFINTVVKRQTFFINMIFNGILLSTSIDQFGLVLETMEILSMNNLRFSKVVDQ